MLDASPGPSPWTGKERTGDASVPHNEPFESDSLSDDCRLARAEVGGRDRPRLEEEPVSSSENRRGGAGEERARTQGTQPAPSSKVHANQQLDAFGISLQREKNEV